MKALVVGSGAREHALGWKLSQSPSIDSLFFAPGNAGTAEFGANLGLGAADLAGIEAFVRSEGIGLVVIGPELPLSLGLVDALEAFPPARRPLCFGPRAAAARIESSKAFAKAFMKKYGIPTAEFEVFTALEPALAFIGKAPWPFVIKASGLASGKGVFIPESPAEAEAVLRSLMGEQSLGRAGLEVVIEERLSGEELSLLGFSDGSNFAIMPPAQDHKRLLEGDRGPNTGGMGAIASATLESMALAEELGKRFLSPAVAGLAAEGCPFVGALYAGLMLTPSGPKALEYNCRFGDPEAEAILPLLDSDLADLLLACAQGRLAGIKPAWKPLAAASAFAVSESYAVQADDPYRREFTDYGLPRGSLLFHGSTRLAEGRPLASGGRLLCAAAAAPSLEEALDLAYSRLARLDLPHARWRRDLGSGRSLLAPGSAALSTGPVQRPSLTRSSSPDPAPPQAAPPRLSYTDSGVDIEAGDRAVELMSQAVRSTYGPEVLAGIGSFGGVYSARRLQGLQKPLLVSSTDGVGTKVKLAAFAGSYRSIGKDIVNHCVDDILVQGARPLFFLDYIASSRLDPEMVAEAVSGMAEACREAGCALIGGETAEMPGVYQAGEFDVAGAIVGWAEEHSLLPRPGLRAGDILVGLPSSGLHTNGFSLVRRIFPESELGGYADLLGRPLVEALLEPHRSYLPWIEPVLQAEPGIVKALAHITGGGFEGNIPRVLPEGLRALVDPSAWPLPPLFELIQAKGEVDPDEMLRVFNMGIGMVAFIDPRDYASFAALCSGPNHIIGVLAEGERGLGFGRLGGEA